MAEAFVGTWVLDGKSDSIDALLEAQGVGFMKRKVMANLSQTLVFEVSGNEVTVKTLTSLKNKEAKFELGGDWVEVEEELTESKAKRKAFMEGAALIVVSENDNGEVKVTRTVEGNVLTVAIVFTKKDGAVTSCKRFFNKQ